MANSIPNRHRVLLKLHSKIQRRYLRVSSEETLHVQLTKVRCMLVVVRRAPVFRDLVALHPEHGVDLLAHMIVGPSDQPLSAVRFAHLRLVHKHDDILRAVGRKEAKIRAVDGEFDAEHIQQIVVARHQR